MKRYILSFLASATLAFAQASIPIEDIATMTSAQLAARVSDKSGTGALLFANGNIGDATGNSLLLGVRHNLGSDGTYTWGQNYTSGTARGRLTWDTGKAIIDSFGDLDLRTSNINRVSITAATTTVTNNLTVTGAGTNAFSGTLSLKDGATADGWFLYTYTDKGFRLNYNGAGSDELILHSNGNLLVGTTVDAGAKINTTTLNTSSSATIGGAASLNGSLVPAATDAVIVNGQGKNLRITSSNSASARSFRATIGTGVSILSDNYQAYSATFQDDAALPSWMVSFGGGPGTDYFRIWRSPAGSTAMTQLLGVDSSGHLQTTGHIALPNGQIYQKEGIAHRWTSDGTSTGTIRGDIYTDSSGVVYVRSGSSASEVSRFTTTGQLNTGTASGSAFTGLVLHNTGTAANTESRIALTTNNASSAQRTAANIRGIMTVTTAGAEESEIWLETRGGGAATGSPALRLMNNGSAAINGTSSVKGVRTATGSFDFGSIVNGAEAATTVTVTGAAVGDSVILTPADGTPFSSSGPIIPMALVTAANTVSVRMVNGSGATLNIGSRNFRVTVFSF